MSDRFDAELDRRINMFKKALAYHPLGGARSASEWIKACLEDTRAWPWQIISHALHTLVHQSDRAFVPNPPEITRMCAWWARRARRAEQGLDPDPYLPTVGEPELHPERELTWARGRFPSLPMGEKRPQLREAVQ